MDLIVVLALTTFGFVIAFTIWSKTRTERKLDRSDTSKSTFARENPDPNFRPDPAITDQKNTGDKR